MNAYTPKRPSYSPAEAYAMEGALLAVMASEGRLTGAKAAVPQNRESQPSARNRRRLMAIGDQKREAVFEAVASGCRIAMDVIRKTKIEESRARLCLRQLEASGRIRKDGTVKIQGGTATIWVPA